MSEDLTFITKDDGTYVYLGHFFVGMIVEHFVSKYQCLYYALGKDFASLSDAILAFKKRYS